MGLLVYSACCYVALIALFVLARRVERRAAAYPDVDDFIDRSPAPGLDGSDSDACEGRCADHDSPRGLGRLLPRDPRFRRPAATATLSGDGPVEAAYQFPGVPARMSLREYSVSGLQQLQVMLIQEQRKRQAADRSPGTRAEQIRERPGQREPLASDQER